MTTRVATNPCHFSVIRQFLHQFFKVFLIVVYHSNIGQVFDKLLFTKDLLVRISFIGQLKYFVDVEFLHETQFLHNLHTHKGGEFDCEMRFAFAFCHESDCLFAEL